MIPLEPIILVISLAYEQACFGFQYTVRMTWMGKATGKLSSKWVPKIGHDVSHQCYIANTFGDDHRSPFWEMWPMIARAYWHWLFTWKPKRCYFEIGNSTKGATLFGCVPRRATDNDGILNKIATPKCWPRTAMNCWPEKTGSQKVILQIRKWYSKTQFGGAWTFCGWICSAFFSLRISHHHWIAFGVAVQR